MPSKPLALAFIALALLIGARVHAQQQPVYCNASNSTACSATSDAGNGTQGDSPWKAFGKLNANDAQLYGMFGATGILYGNGAVPNALTAATGAQILAAIFSGSCNAQTGTSYTAYPVGTQLTIEELGAGITTVAPAGASCPPQIFRCALTGCHPQTFSYAAIGAREYS